MSDLELSKNKIILQLQKICAHCATGRTHDCPLQTIASQVKSISGVPLIVNNEFRGVLWNQRFRTKEGLTMTENTLNAKPAFPFLRVAGVVLGLGITVGCAMGLLFTVPSPKIEPDPARKPYTEEETSELIHETGSQLTGRYFEDSRPHFFCLSSETHSETLLYKVAKISHFCLFSQ